MLGEGVVAYVSVAESGWWESGVDVGAAIAREEGKRASWSVPSVDESVKKMNEQPGGETAQRVGGNSFVAAVVECEESVASEVVGGRRCCCCCCCCCRRRR